MIVLRFLLYTQALYTHAVTYIKFLKDDFERQCSNDSFTRFIIHASIIHACCHIYMIEIKFLKHDFERQCIWSVQHEVCNKIFWKENA